MELISSYSFNLYYIKGKDKVLSDFLSRQKHDDSDPHEIIPISFNTYNALYDTYYRIDPQDLYLVTDTITDKSDRNDIARSAWCKGNIRHKGITRKTKAQIQAKQVVKIRPKLGIGRTGIIFKKPNLLLT